MTASASGEKKQLSICKCTVQTNGNTTVDTSTSYEVMINPATFSHEYSITYNQQPTLGQLASESMFSAINPDKISFDIVIDGTGAVTTSSAATAQQDVATQIRTLESVVYKYDGNSHEPNHVRVLWGSLVFYGRMDSMSVEYTLFKPGGDPLRARIKLSFTGFMSKEEESLRANRSSPDLTHYVVVRAGDTLPLMCYRIYRDPDYYREVARVNNLSSVRDLRVGDRLYFPPLGRGSET